MSSGSQGRDIVGRSRELTLDMMCRRSAAALAGTALLLLAWVAQAQQEPQTRSHSATVPMAGSGVDAEPPRGNDPAEEFPNASSADPSPPCFPARWHRVLLRPDTGDAADPTVIHLVPRTTLVLGVLLILMLHLSALIVWPVAAMVRRAGSRSAAAAPRGFPRLTAGAVITLSVGFWWWVRASHDIMLALLTLRLPPMVSRMLFSDLHPSGQMDWLAAGQLRWLGDEVVRNCGYHPLVLPLFYIPYVTAAATVYVLYLAFRSWRETWWTGLERVHYSFVAITLAWYPFHLYALGFIL